MTLSGSPTVLTDIRIEPAAEEQRRDVPLEVIVGDDGHGFRSFSSCLSGVQDHSDSGVL
jgi:hypothetical protein